MIGHKQPTKKALELEARSQKYLKRSNSTTKVIWENSSSGIVEIGDESREFVIEGNSMGDAIYLVTSSGSMICSYWDAGKENHFIQAVIRDCKRSSNIVGRLKSISLAITGSKKQRSWFAVSPEEFSIKTGCLMRNVKSLSNGEALVEFDHALSATAYTKAQEFAMSNGFGYVEGFLLVDKILQPHAWVIDFNGSSFETYYKPISGAQYFGTVLNLEHSLQILESRIQDAPADRLASILNGCYLDSNQLLKIGLDFIRDYEVQARMICGF